MKSAIGDVEVLAPAGSFEAITAAIQAGADAVYFGIEQLNMRARSANNFTINDLSVIEAQCKVSGVKTCLTLNTILYDHDMQLMRKIISTAKEAGIGAVIASDYAVMTYAKLIGLPLHISTQANVSNIDTVEFLSSFGDVMVVARELTLKQIAEIVKEIKRRKITGPSGNLVKIEVFVHGALCMAVSGKCYMSLHSHYASANRGACLQNCRRPYVVTDKEEGIEFEIDNEYIMSAKDLSTIDILDRVLDTGVSVLKIEGRGRAPDYVYTVTKCYKEAKESIVHGQFSADKIELWKKELSTVYNRGFWEGYYLGRKLGEWADQPGSMAVEKKIYIGRGNRYYPKIQIGEFFLESGTLKLGDTLMVIGRSVGVSKSVVNELKINGVDATQATKGDIITLPWSSKVSKDDKLYKIVEIDDA